MRRLVGRNFARIRRERGLTQQEVEERSGFSQQYLSGLEQGHRNPSIISLYEIAAALEVSVLDFLAGAPLPDFPSGFVPAAGAGATNPDAGVPAKGSEKAFGSDHRGQSRVLPPDPDQPASGVTDDEWFRLGLLQSRAVLADRDDRNPAEEIASGYRVHILRISVSRTGPDPDHSLRWYTRHGDPGNDPRLVLLRDQDSIVVRCSDRFRLDPDDTKKAVNRVDLYLPGDSAAAMAMEIGRMAAYGDTAGSAGIHSGMARLPQVSCEGFAASISGCAIAGGRAGLFVDVVYPRGSRMEMSAPDIHLGLRLEHVSGRIDRTLYQDLHLWKSPGRRQSAGKSGDVTLHPAPAAIGLVEFRFERAQAARLAACLTYSARLAMSEK